MQLRIVMKFLCAHFRHGAFQSDRTNILVYFRTVLTPRECDKNVILYIYMYKKSTFFNKFAGSNENKLKKI